MPKSLQDRKAELSKRMVDLAARIDEIGTELQSHQTRDWSDLATERESDEVLEGMGLSAQAEIRAIEAALDRCGAGTYGVCTRCGAGISDARLDVLPFTPLCRDCAAQAQ